MRNAGGGRCVGVGNTKRGKKKVETGKFGETMDVVERGLEKAGGGRGGSGKEWKRKKEYVTKVR